MQPVIEVSHLTKIFNGTPAVDDISFQVLRGELLGFLGPNGAGKTTTIAMLLGVFYPLSVYPDWLVRGLVLMPLPHVFEGMRQVLGGRPLPWTNVWTAFGLDAFYLLAAFIFFGYMFTLARERGLLLKAQE